MKQVKLGVVGCGGIIANTHMQNVLAGKCPSIVVTAVSNRTVAKATAVGEMLAKAGMPATVYETDEELIANADVDAVVICTPHFQHEALAVQAFERGLHVLCEKPSGAYTLQARAINAAADKAGTVFGMVFHHRTNPMNIKIREIVKSGMLGEIRRINWISTDSFRGQGYYDSIAWRGTWETDGSGVLLNQAPHRLDLFQWIFGMPTKITGFLGMGRWHDIEVEDDVTAVMEFENGASAIFIGSTSDCPGTNRLEITAEFGKLVCEDDKITFHHLAESLTDFSKNEPTGLKAPAVTVEDFPLEGTYTAQGGILEGFGRAILEEGVEPIADGRDGYNSLAIANALIYSQWNGNKTIAFPFEADFEEDYFKQLKAHF